MFAGAKARWMESGQMHVHVQVGADQVWRYLEHEYMGANHYGARTFLKEKEDGLHVGFSLPGGGSWRKTAPIRMEILVDSELAEEFHIGGIKLRDIFDKEEF